MMGVRDILNKVLPGRAPISEPTLRRGGPLCDHIPEARITAGTLTNPAAWLCKDCGRYLVVKKEG